MCDFVRPLKSIVQDKASLMDLTATSLASASLQDVENGNYQLIFASAEEILAKPFLSSLKNRIYTTRKTVTRATFESCGVGTTKGGITLYIELEIET